MAKPFSFFFEANSKKKKKNVMKILLVLIVRISVILWWSDGYIHPDEFFQSGQELWYGKRLPSWEFQSPHYLRSIVPPTIMTYLPLTLFSSKNVYLVPRLFMGLVSFILLDVPLLMVETSVDGMSSSSSSSIWYTMWTTWTLFHRPFTNVMESWYVAMTLHLLSSSNQPPFLYYIGLGILSSFGMNCRFTFGLFVGPAILYHFIRLVHQNHHPYYSTTSIIGTRIFGTIIGFVGTSILWIYMDTNYYDTASIQITPWNAFQYNRQVSNLQHHGIHPHYLHILVNMPLLYGPLAIYFYYTELFPHKQTKPMENNNNSSSVGNGNSKIYCRIILWSGLFGLSIAPHQEPRFLLPLAYPLVQLYKKDDCFLFQRKSIKILWWIWTIGVGCWFSLLHQSAVIPSLHYISQQQHVTIPKAILYYHTYMPPTFVLSSSMMINKLVVGDPPISSAVCPLSQQVLSKEKNTTYFYDLTSNDASLETLEHTMDRHLDSSLESFVYVVAPKASIPNHTLIKKKYQWTPLWSQFQISMEELPSTPIFHTLLTNPSSFHLVIWQVKSVLN